MTEYYYMISIVLLVASMLFAFYAQFKVSHNYNKYSEVQNRRRITGSEAARRILDQNGLQGVSIEMAEGKLSDHYDPKHQVVRLSKGVHQGTSIASVGIAAHEVGHAVQHATGYTALTVRNSMVPVVNIASNLAMPMIIIGLIISNFESLLWIGILFYAAAVLFQLITLPVEFNASSRAMTMLSDYGIIDSTESPQVRKVLSAAAMTYVAAMAVALANLLRFVMIAIARRD